MNTQPTAPCVRHPQAPVIGGMCGGCTVVPSERAVPLLAEVQPAVSGVSAEEAAANVTAAVPVLAAAGLPAAEACTSPYHTGPIRAHLGCTGPDPAVTVPRTKRAYWQDITDALNALHTAGGSIGIDLDGTLTDHRAWSVVWDRDNERWTLAGYDDEPEGTKEAPAAEQPTDGAESPEDAARRFARRLAAVEQLCSGRPGYHTVTVKRLLTAMGEATDEGQEQPLAAAPAAVEPPLLDPFTEAAVRRGALLGGADAIEALPQDHECDPGRGDAVKLLRRLAGLTSTTEQPAGLTWEARADHAVRLYATTAIELEDARRENGRLRERLAELEQGQADADALAAEFPDTIASLVDEIADDIPHRRAPHIAAAYLNRHARLLADQITTLGQARSWSTWAAEYIHPDREFIDPGKDDDQAEQQLAVPGVGDRYKKRATPDAGRIVTVSRVWVADSGRTAVAYDWRDDKPGECASACPIDVFHRTYKAVEEQPLAFPQLAVPCPRCKAPARQLCTSHGGTRQRTNDAHQDRTRAYRATQAGR